MLENVMHIFSGVQYLDPGIENLNIFNNKTDPNPIFTEFNGSVKLYNLKIHDFCIGYTALLSYTRVYFFYFLVVCKYSR